MIRSSLTVVHFSVWDLVSVLRSESEMGPWYVGFGRGKWYVVRGTREGGRSLKAGGSEPEIRALPQTSNPGLKPGRLAQSRGLASAPTAGF